MAGSSLFAGDYPVTQGFGPTDVSLEPAGFGYPHFHSGVDLGLPIDTPLYAPEAGTVAVLQDPSGYGTYELFTPTSNPQEQLLLGHLDQALASGPVSAGAEIGLSGSSGLSTGPHLHLGETLGGQIVDPSSLLNSDAPGSPSGQDLLNQFRQRPLKPGPAVPYDVSHPNASPGQQVGDALGRGASAIGSAAGGAAGSILGPDPLGIRAAQASLGRATKSAGNTIKASIFPLVVGVVVLIVIFHDQQPQLPQLPRPIPVPV